MELYQTQTFPQSKENSKEIPNRMGQEVFASFFLLMENGDMQISGDKIHKVTNKYDSKMY